MISTKKNISISVVIPAYNRSKLMIETLDSVVNQTLPFDEIIVVDDVSTDDTLAVINAYSHRERLILFSLEANSGAQAARNKGITAAKSDFVLLLDSDNTVSLHYVEKIKEHLQAGPDIDVLTNFSKIVGDTTKHSRLGWITKGNILLPLLKGETYVDNSSACIRRSKLLEIGMLDEKCPSFQEWDTHIRLASAGCVYDTVAEELTNYLEHDGERISSKPKIWGRGLYVLKKHRKTWLQTAGKDVYKHYLIHNYDTAKKQGDRFFAFRVWLQIIKIYPPVLKSFIKRKINAR